MGYFILGTNVFGPSRAIDKNRRLKGPLEVQAATSTATTRSAGASGQAACQGIPTTAHLDRGGPPKPERNSRMEDALAVRPTLATFARVVSDLFSPPALAVPGLLLAVAASDESGTYRFAIVYLLMAVVLPVLYVVWLLKSGRISDFHLSDRRQRRGPFVASLICGIAGFALVAYMGAPSSLLGPVAGLLAEILLLFVISLAWQVSVHTATTAGLVTYACLAFGPVAACWALLVPVVAWARIYLRRHTLAQTLAGAWLGVACFVTLYALRGIAW